jgi:uncharacterized protein YeaO (DUF488 family)
MYGFSRIHAPTELAKDGDDAPRVSREEPGRREMLALKRVYDQAAPEDGVRFLVERLWPRAVKKTDVRLDAWLKDVAPSDALRRWFSHDPKKWAEFQRRYFAELDSHPEVFEPIRRAARHGRVTLVYSSHDTEHNNAIALKEYLDARSGRKRRINHT